MLKPDPAMPDDAATVEVITEGCTIHGSPQTFLDKLIAFRERSVRSAAADDGPRLERTNRAWERNSMRLFAQEVIPKFRQHVMAQAAE